MNWLKLLTKTKILSVDPGNIIIINVEKPLTGKQVRSISNALNKMMPDNMVIILDDVGKVQLSKIKG